MYGSHNQAGYYDAPCVPYEAFDLDMHPVFYGTQGCGIIVLTDESPVLDGYAMGFSTYAYMGNSYTESVLFLRVRINFWHDYSMGFIAYAYMGN